eukprot:scaffold129965_cov59-Attheya_sp.AAC.1
MRPWRGPWDNREETYAHRTTTANNQVSTNTRGNVPYMEEADAAMVRALGQPGGTRRWNLANEAGAARWTAFPPLFDARATVNTAASRYDNDDDDYDDEVDEGKEDEVKGVGAIASSSSASEVTSWFEDISLS